MKDGKFETQSKFPITKQHKYFYLHQQYNAFIMKQDGVSGNDIANWLTGYYEEYRDTRVSYSYSSMRRVYRASERLVIDVSKGLF